MDQPITSRRDFLKGKSAARAIEQLADHCLSGDAPPLPPVESDRYLVKYSRRAMACEFEIWLNAGQYSGSGEVALASLDLIEQLESQLTVYRDSSEISQLNQIASRQPTQVESRLFALLTQCVELWQRTGGAFDITAGPLTDLWGFRRRAGRMPDQESIDSALGRVGSQHLKLDSDGCRVCFDRTGLEINLGAIGKGYALDRSAKLFESESIHDYLIHGGNSSVLGRGACATRDGDGWSIGVRHPLRPQQYLGEVIVRNKALSTSGSGTQYFEHGGKRYGHILDPRNGWPAQGVLTVTVLAPAAAEAEALSTACYVLGPADTDRLLAPTPTIGCLMICPGEEVGSIEIHTWNIGDGEWVPRD